MKIHTDPVSLTVAVGVGWLAVASLVDGHPLAALLFAAIAVAVLTRRHATAMGSP